MQQFEDMEMQLWEYLDRTCSEAERQRIEQFIASDETWRKKYNELQMLQGQLSNMEPHHPSMRFTANVMDNIAGAQVAGKTARYLNSWVIKGIAAFFLLILTCSVIYSIIVVDWTQSNTGKLDLQKFVKGDVLTVVKFINVILALMLIDKFLNKRTKQKTLV